MFSGKLFNRSSIALGLTVVGLAVSNQALGVVLTALAVSGLAVLAVIFYWKQRQSEMYRRYYEQEVENKRIEKELARLGQLRLVGEIAAGMGHEIRNPMTTVRGYLQILGKKEELAEFQGQINLMIEELDRANEIMTEFLSLAKNKVVAKEAKDINCIVNAMLPLIKAEALKCGKTVYAALGQVPELPVDEKEIRQLLLNICMNGLEAMNRGGSLTIRTYLENDCVVLSVKDEGCGITAELLEKMGTPFVTTKTGGTGLGLAICYSIASRHNAQINIFSKPEYGTTVNVEFTLPELTELPEQPDGMAAQGI